MFNPFQPSVVFHLETSHLFWFTKEITGFYVKFRGCSSGIASTYFFQPSKVWSMLHHGLVREKFFIIKIFVFIMIFTALPFLRLIYGLILTRRKCQPDCMFNTGLKWVGEDFCPTNISNSAAGNVAFACLIFQAPTPQKGCYQRIVWVCLIILWGLAPKRLMKIYFRNY